MYKHAHGGSSTTIRHPKSAPNSYWRQFYYSTIHEELRLDRKFSAYYHRNAPAWLLEEVTRFTPSKWLAYWDQKTGRPRKRLKPDFKKAGGPLLPGEIQRPLALRKSYYRNFYST